MLKGTKLQKPAFMDKLFSTPSERAIEEALNHSNGYVYVIDEEYSGKQDVPAEAIAGAWKVNEHGIIAGPFIPNAQYKTNKQGRFNYLVKPFMKYLLSISALVGIFFGVYLMALAYTTKLSSPAANNIVILLGIVLFSGCSLYLMLKVIKRFVF